jgi:hypothetical protein
MHPLKWEIYKIDYKGYEMEGVYMGPSKRWRGQHLILLNISPESSRLPIHFPLITIKNFYMDNNKIIYSMGPRSKNSKKLGNLEQESLNEYGKYKWEKKSKTL